MIFQFRCSYVRIVSLVGFWSCFNEISTFLVCCSRPPFLCFVF